MKRGGDDLDPESEKKIKFDGEELIITDPE